MKYNRWVFLVILVSFILVLSSSSFASQGYCGNPYLISQGYNPSYYCPTGEYKLEMEGGLGTCCPTSDTIGIYDANDPFKPNNQQDCKTNYFHLTDVFSIPACTKGCCYRVDSDSCSVQTNYSCLSAPGSNQNNKFTFGFTNTPDPCYSSNNVPAFSECGGASCSDLTIDSCTSDTGCRWCPQDNPANSRCVSNCLDCAGKTSVNQVNNQCISPENICGGLSVGDCTNPSNQCFWCSSGSGSCVSDCNSCTGYGSDNDNDRTCDSFNTCSNIGNMPDCKQNSNCLWCGLTTGGGFGCVDNSCQGCRFTVPMNIQGECKDTCNDGVDNDGDGSIDQNDLCCNSCTSPPCNENQDCIPYCPSLGDLGITSSQRISSLPKSSYPDNWKTINGVDYCKCGPQPSGSLFFIHNQNSNDYCCLDSGIRFNFSIPCARTSLFICIRDSNGNDIDCSGGNKCRVDITWHDGTGSYSSSLSDFSYANSLGMGIGCLRTSPNIPKNTDIIINARYTEVGEYRDSTLSVDSGEGNTQSNPIPITLSSVDKSCWGSNVEFNINAIAIECQENKLNFRWSLNSTISPGTSCNQNIQRIDVERTDAGYFTAFSLHSSNARSGIYALNNIDLPFGKIASFRVNITYFDPECSQEPCTGATVKESFILTNVKTGDLYCKLGCESGTLKSSQGYFCYGNTKVKCDNKNIILEDPICDLDKICTAGRCEPFSNCNTYNIINTFFGMYPQKGTEKCEDDGLGNSKFCYLDYSQTNVDSCNRCELNTGCFDYDSQDTCLRDPCSIVSRSPDLTPMGDCDWFESDYNFKEFGYGYCFSPQYNGTEYCSLCGPETGLFLKNIHCSPQVCDILGACYSTNPNTNLSCSACSKRGSSNPTSCYDFKDKYSCVQSHGKKTTGIDKPFSITDEGCDFSKCAEESGFRWSDDACGIGICKWNSNTKTCYKDGNHNGLDDCGQDESCRRDSFYGITTVQSSPVILSGDSINTIIFRLNHSGGNIGESRIFACIDREENGNCIPNTPLTLVSSDSVQKIETFKWEFTPNTDQGFEGIKEYNGDARLRFYSIDRYDNIEPINSIILQVDSAVSVSYEHELIPAGNERTKLKINITSNEYISGCYVCFTNANVNNYDSCISAPASSYVKITPIDNEPIDPLNIDHHYRYLVRETTSFEDGNYHLTLKCVDSNDNIYNSHLPLYVASYRNITNAYPINQRYSRADIISGLLNLKISVRNHNLACWYQDISNNMAWARFNDPSLLGSIYNYEKDYRGSADSIQSGYYSVNVSCYNYYCSDSPSQTSCPIIDSVILDFSVDKTHPNTSLYYKPSAGSSEWHPITSNLRFKSLILGFNCSDGINYGSLGPFGCKNVSYCNYPTGQCDPSLYGIYLSSEGKSNSFFSSVPSSFSQLTDNQNICFYSTDHGGNKETLKCQTIQIDNSPPVIQISSPSNYGLIGPENSQTRSLQISGSWQDNSANTIGMSVNYWNNTHVADSDYYSFSGSLGATSGTFQFTVELLGGENTIRIDAWDTGIINGYNINSVYLNMIWDKTPPVFYQTKMYSNSGTDLTIINEASSSPYVEYGDNVIFNASVNDTMWHGENLSAVMVELKCISGYCHNVTTPKHRFFLEKKEGIKWHYNLEPEDPSYGHTSKKDILPGKYNVTFYAWDGYYDWEGYLINGLFPSADDLNSFTEGTHNNIIESLNQNANLQTNSVFLQVNDSQVNEVMVMMYTHSDFKSLETEFPVFGINSMNERLIVVEASEPIIIEAGDFSYNLQDGTQKGCNERILSYNGNVEYKNTHEYSFVTSSSSCYNNSQDKYRELGNNSEFLITFKDKAGNIGTAQRILTGTIEGNESWRYFEIDTLPPDNIRFLQDSNIVVKDSKINISGFAERTSQFGGSSGETIPDHSINITIEHKNVADSSERLVNTYTVNSMVTNQVNSTQILSENANEGDTVFYVLDNSVNCRDTEFIDLTKYILFTNHIRSNNYYYDIISTSCEQEDSRRKVEISTMLESSVSQGDALKVFDNSAPKGWFELEIDLAENSGLNTFSIFGVDYLKNRGNVSVIEAVFDGIPPVIEIISPFDDNWIGENNTPIAFISYDNSSGIIGSSGINKGSLRINVSEFSYNQSYEIGDLISSEIYDCNHQYVRCINLDEEAVLFELLIPGGLKNRYYVVNATSEDNVGHRSSIRWEFGVNNNVPRGLSLIFDENDGVYQEGDVPSKWYLNKSRPNFELSFSLDNIFVELTHISIKNNMDVNAVCIRLDALRYACEFDDSLNESIYYLNVSAKKAICDIDRLTDPSYECMGHEGHWTFPFIIDLTDPIITIEDIEVSNNYNNREVRGFVNDTNLLQVELKGDIHPSKDLVVGNEILRGSSSFSSTVNFSSVNLYPELTAVARDKSGRTSTSKKTTYVDVHVSAVTLDNIPNPSLHSILNVSGYSPDLNTRVTIKNAEMPGASCSPSKNVLEKPTDKFSFKINQDVCRSINPYEIRVQNNQTVEIISIGYDDLEIEIFDLDGQTLIKDSTLNHNEKESLSFSKDGRYKVKASSPAEVCSDSYIVVDTQENHRFNIALDKNCLVNNRYNSIYATSEDDFGNINRSGTISVFIDGNPGDVSDMYPAPNSYFNSIRTKISFIITDNFGIDSSTLSYSISNGSYTRDFIASESKGVCLESRQDGGCIRYKYEDMHDVGYSRYQVIVSFDDTAGNSYIGPIGSDSWVFTVSDSVPSPPSFIYKNSNYDSSSGIYHFRDLKPLIEFSFEDDIVITTLEILKNQEDYLTLDIGENLNIIEDKRRYELNKTLDYNIVEFYQLKICARNDVLGAAPSGCYYSDKFFIDNQVPQLAVNNSGKSSNVPIDITGKVANENQNSMPSYESLIRAIHNENNWEVLGSSEFGNDLFFSLFLSGVSATQFRQGENVFSVSARDLAGNEGLESWNIFFDNIPPTPPVLSTGLSFDGEYYYALQSLAIINLTVYEDGEINIFRNNFLVHNSHQSQIHKSYSVSLGHGINIFNASHRDAYGNSASSNTIKIVFDHGPKFYGGAPNNTIIGGHYPSYLEIYVYSDYGKIDDGSAKLYINNWVVPQKDIGKEKVGNAYRLYLKNPEAFVNWNVKTQEEESGLNRISFKCSDLSGKETETNFEFVMDSRLPRIVDAFNRNSPFNHYFTKEKSPEIWIRFNEPTKIESAVLNKGSSTKNLIPNNLYSSDNITYRYNLKADDNFNGQNYNFEVSGIINPAFFLDDDIYVAFNSQVNNAAAYLIRHDSSNGEYELMNITTAILQGGAEIKISPSDGPFTKQGMIYHLFVSGTAPSFESIESIRFNIPVIKELGINVSIDSSKISYSGKDEYGYNFSYSGGNGNIILSEGEYSLNIKAKLLGVQNSPISDDRLRFIIDTTNPSIYFTTNNPYYSNEGNTQVEGNYYDFPSGHDTIESIAVSSFQQNCQLSLNANSRFSANCQLIAGENDVVSEISDKAGNSNSSEMKVFVDSSSPTVNIVPINAISTENGYFINNPSLIANILLSRAGDLKIYQNHNMVLSNNADLSFEHGFNLNQGINHLSANITDRYGNTADTELHVFYDNQLPMFDDYDYYPLMNSVVGNKNSIIYIKVVDLESGIDEDSIEIQLNGNLLTNLRYRDNRIISEEGVELLEGLNDITVRVSDNAGNSNSKSWQFSYDPNAPAFEKVISPDFYTNQDPLIISFSYLNPVNVTSLVISGDNIGSISLVYSSINNNRLFSSDASSDALDSLQDGLYEVTIEAKKLDIDNSSTFTQKFYFRMDTLKPTLRIISPQEIKHPSCDIDLSGVWDEENELKKISYSLDYGVEYPMDMIDINSKRFRSTVSIPKKYREYNLYVNIEDMASNVNIYEQKVMCDPDAPIIVLKSSAELFKFQPVSLEIQLNEESEVSIDINGYEDNLGINNGNFFYQLSLESGYNIITGTAVDNVGHTSQSNVLMILFDDLPPEILSVYPAEGDIIGTKEVRIIIFADDLGSGLDYSSASFKLNGEDKSIVFGDGSFNYDSSVNDIRASNQALFTIKDRAGNSKTISWQFSYDASAPSISEFISPDYFTSNNKPEITFRYDERVIIKAVSLTNKGSGTKIDINPSYFTTNDNKLFSYGLNNILSDGAYSVNVKANLMGKDSVSSETYTFFIDTEAPTITVDSDISSYSRKINFEIKGDAMDNILLDTVTIKVNDGFEVPSDIVDTIQGRYYHTVRLNKPENLITITGYDKAGNKRSIIHNVVLDTSIPLISISGVRESIRDSNGFYRLNSNEATLDGNFFEAYLDTIYIEGDVRIFADVNNDDNSFSITKSIVGYSNTETYNSIKVFIKDLAGDLNHDEVVIINDQKGPEITFLSPEKDAINYKKPKIEIRTDEDSLECKIRYNDENGLSIVQELTKSSPNSFNALLSNNLKENHYNNLDVYCKDLLGNENSERKTIYVDTTPPVIKNIYMFASEKTNGDSTSASFIVFINETNFEIEASEKVFCRYGLSTDFSSMDFFNPSNPYYFDSTHTSDYFKVQDLQRYTYYINCEDEAGNRLNPSFIAEVQADLNSPIRVVNIDPIDYTNRNNPVISWQTFRDSSCLIAYYDISEWTPYVSASSLFKDRVYNHSIKADLVSPKLRNLNDGQIYHFKIHCDDAQGIRGAGKVNFNFTYDVTLLPPKIISPEEGFISSAPKIDLIGEAEAGSNIQLYVNDVKQGPLFKTADDGSFEKSVLLTKGENRVTVRAYDLAGNTAFSTVSGVYDAGGVIIKAIVPLSTSILPSLKNITAYFDDVNDVGLHIDHNTIVLMKDTQRIKGTVVSVDSGNTAVFIPESPLTEGSYYITVLGKDYDGNIVYGTSDFKIVYGIPYLEQYLPPKWADYVKTSSSQIFAGSIKSPSQLEYTITAADFHLQGLRTNLCEGQICDSDGFISFSMNNSLTREGVNNYHYLITSSADPLKFSRYVGQIIKDTLGPDYLNMRVNESIEYNTTGLAAGVTSASTRAEITIDFTKNKKPAINIRFNERVIITTISLHLLDSSGNKKGSSIPLELISSYRKKDFIYEPKEELNQDGEYLLTISATDLYGNEMKYNPLSRTFILDTVNPTINVVSPVINSIVKTENVQIEFQIDEPAKINSIKANNDDITSYFTQGKYLRSYVKQLNIPIENRVELTIEVEDYAGNNQIIKHPFIHITKPLSITLIDPSFGVDKKLPIYVRINTSRPVENGNCRFNIDSDLEFDQMKDIMHSSLDGLTHYYATFPKQGKIFIRCKDIYEEFGSASFDLSIDQDRPTIINKKVTPGVVTEEPKVTIEVETDEETRCYYKDHEGTRINFPGWDEGLFKKKNSVVASTPLQDNQYSYDVICEDKAENPSLPASLLFDVRLGQVFKIIDKTPKFFMAKTVYLEFMTNKQAFCYYGLTIGSRNEVETSDGYNFKKLITVEGEGNNSYYVSCFARKESTVEDTIIISFVVDTVKPEMLYVNLSDPFYNSSITTWRTENLKGMWKANDSLSGINRYQVDLIRDEFANESVVISFNTTSEESTLTGFKLEDLTNYYLEIRAVDNAGHLSDKMESNRMFINYSLKPPEEIKPSCADNLKNQDETDIDCGGICSPCTDGKLCILDSDCRSNKCTDGICQNTYVCNRKVDLDCDKVPNTQDPDIDGDRIENWLDPDDDNDGLCDTLFSPLNEGKCKGDDDDDNDNGILDPEDKDPDNDLNNNGISNDVDDDIDGDALKNWEDPDDDNDGLCDTLFSPLNTWSEWHIEKFGNPLNLEIGTPLCRDEDDDDDNDGILDIHDVQKDNDYDNDGRTNYEDPDIDGDLLMNWEDPDDDNDGICNTLYSPLNRWSQWHINRFGNPQNLEIGTPLCRDYDEDSNNNELKDHEEKRPIYDWCYVSKNPDKYLPLLSFDGKCSELGRTGIDTKVGGENRCYVYNFVNKGSCDSNGMHGDAFDVKSDIGIGNTDWCFNRPEPEFYSEVIFKGKCSSVGKTGVDLKDGDYTSNGIPNFLDSDMDGDGIPNFLDVDNDNDQIADSAENNPMYIPSYIPKNLAKDISYIEDGEKLVPIGGDNNVGGTSSFETRDIDQDGLPDWWEIKYGLDPYKNDAHEDPDNDGLTNLEEYMLKDKYGESTNPMDPDTDGDGYSDGDEVNKYGTNPLDKNDYPKKPWGFILTMLLILIVLGVGGYFGYKRYREFERENPSHPMLQKLKQLFQKIGLGNLIHVSERFIHQPQNYQRAGYQQQKTQAFSSNMQMRGVDSQTNPQANPLIQKQRSESPLAQKLRSLKGKNLKSMNQEPIDNLYALGKELALEKDKKDLIERIGPVSNLSRAEIHSLNKIPLEVIRSKLKESNKSNYEKNLREIISKSESKDYLDLKTLVNRKSYERELEGYMDIKEFTGRNALNDNELFVLANLSSRDKSLRIKGRSPEKIKQTASELANEFEARKEPQSKRITGKSQKTSEKLTNIISDINSKISKDSKLKQLKDNKIKPKQAEKTIDSLNKKKVVDEKQKESPMKRLSNFINKNKK